MAPIDRGSQCLLPLGNVDWTGREHLERVVETLEQRFRREEPESGSCELQRERQAVQPLTDGLHGFGVVVRQLEGASAQPRALDEQRNGRREPERRERILAFCGDPKRRPARGDEPQRGAALDQARHLRSGGHDLLEVVQEQERLLVADQLREALAERALFGLLDVQCVGNGGDQQCGIDHVGQRDECDAVQKLGREHPAELDRRPASCQHRRDR